jgi:hypothetical protein
MFEKFGLTQEIGVTLDRIRDLSKGRYVIRKRGCWGDTLFLSISSRLACSTLSSAFRFCFFCVRSAAFFIRANFEGDAGGAFYATLIRRSGSAQLGGTHVFFALQLINLFLVLAVGISVVHKFTLAIRALAGLEIGLLREDASV